MNQNKKLIEKMYEGRKAETARKAVVEAGTVPMHQDTSYGKTQDVPTGTYAAIAIPENELEELRDRYTKVYEGPDHTRVARIFLEPIHYQTSDGAWKEHNEVTAEIQKQTQVKSTKGKTSSTNATYTYGSGCPSISMGRVDDGSHSMCWGIRDADPLAEITQGEDSLTFRDILTDTDIVCRTGKNEGKEDILLKTASAPNEVTYSYTFSGLVPYLEENQVLLKDFSDETCFTVSAPVMRDAAGEESDRIAIQVKETGEDSCEITFTMDQEWLKDPARVFPVTVDPWTTTALGITEIKDTFVDSSDPADTTKYVNEFLRTDGGNCIRRSFLKFSLPAISSADIVTDARLYLVGTSTGGSHTVKVHRVLQNWEPQYTVWNTKPVYEERTLDYCKYTISQPKHIILDVTQAVRDWYNTGKNYGLMIRNEGELSGSECYLSSDNEYGQDEIRPFIQISYQNFTGLEDQWSYHAQDAGRAGTIYENDCTGNLILVHDTMSTGGSRMPVSIQHVYNTTDRNTNIGYGLGWRVNYHQTISQEVIGQNTYYCHTDGDGTRHYFAKDNSTNKWTDEQNPQMTLTLPTSSDAHYRIKSDDGSSLVFNGSGYLTTLIDNSGNNIQIVYTGKRISKVTDGAGRICTLSYHTDSNGNETTLKQIQSPSGQVKTFSYDGSQRLTKITDIDQSVLLYSYHASGNYLTGVTNLDGKKYTFSYYTASGAVRMKTITETGGTTAGKKLTVSYGNNSTCFTDHKGRKEIYRFNNAGCVIFAQDGFGHAIGCNYGSGNKNYRLSNQTKAQDNVIQLLKDPLVQAGTLGWSKKTATDFSGSMAVNTDTAYCKIGTRSLKIISNAGTGYGYWYEDITCIKGTEYTASVYAYAKFTEKPSGSVRLQISYYDENGVYKDAFSEMLRSDTNGFVRLSASFKLPKEATSTTVRVKLVMIYAKGTAYFDMAQLETGNTPNRVNLVDNGSFHLGTASGFSKSGKAEDGVVTAGATVSNAYRLPMMVTASSAKLYQTPSESSTVLATLNKGTRMCAFCSTGGFFHVLTSTGKEGYIKTGSTQDYVGGAETVYTGVFWNAGTVIRSSASASGAVVKNAVPKGTMVSIRSTTQDTAGNTWALINMLEDTSIYNGYVKESQLIRMAVNLPRVKMTAADSYFTTPSLSGTTSSTVASGASVNVHGTVTLDNGTLFYAVKSGTGYKYLPSRHTTVVTDVSFARKRNIKVPEVVDGLGDTVYRFYGEPEKEKKLTKTLSITGNKGDTYLVNAWGNGPSLPMPSENDEARHFGVEVAFVPASGSSDVHNIDFCDDILDWQFLSQAVAAKVAYTSIKVSYVYSHQLDAACFDGLSLFREEFGQTYTYDDKDRVVTAVDAQKKAEKFEYNNTNDLTGITNALGKKFTYTYDSKHRVTKGVSAAQNEYHLAYDSYGNVVKSGAVPYGTSGNSGSGTWINRTMDTNGNHVVKVIDTAGNPEEYTWDSKDLMTSKKDGRGKTVNFAYDAAERLVSVSQTATVDGVAKTIKNEYTYSMDRLTGIRHNDFDYSFTYDAFGNQLQTKAGGVMLASRSYEANNGNLLKVTYGNGAYIRYEYDAQDRLAQSYYLAPGSTAETALNTYTYDRQGNLYKVYAAPTGRTYYMEYDLLDRLARVRDNNGCYYQYTYDAENQMTRLLHANGSYTTKLEYTYDGDGRETETAVNGSYHRSVFYDSFGRVTDYYWSEANKGMVFEYPSSGTRECVRPDVVYINGMQHSYTYDANGNITRIQISSPDPSIPVTAERYQYDERNQLIREDSQKQNKTFVYAYDEGGNLKSVRQYAYTTADTISGNPVSTVTGTFATGWKDQLTSWNNQAITYDGCGNMTSRGNISYTWTQGRRLAAVNNGTSISYQYDHTGMRTKKTVGSTITEYRWAGSLLMSETTGNRTIRYYYDSNSNAIAFSINNATYFYMRNLQNDVISIMDSSWNTVVEYQYDSWGRLLGITGSLKDTVGVYNPFRYRGYYYDTETGMYYLRSRYYDPEIKRFISADSLISIEINGLNTYNYCYNNPVNMIDINGHFPELLRKIGSKINNYLTNLVTPIKNRIKATIQIANKKSSEADRRPYRGKPGSVYHAPNGDWRRYGPDGLPEKDYDHSDHGFPKKHPHDERGGHYHDWENGIHGPAHLFSGNYVLGGLMVVGSLVGMAIITLDDATGIGVADDSLFSLLGESFAKGILMLFGR